MIQIPGGGAFGWWRSLTFRYATWGSMCHDPQHCAHQSCTPADLVRSRVVANSLLPSEVVANSPLPVRVATTMYICDSQDQILVWAARQESLNPIQLLSLGFKATHPPTTEADPS